MKFESTVFEFPTRICSCIFREKKFCSMISETPGDDFKKFSFIMFPYRVIGVI